MTNEGTIRVHRILGGSEAAFHVMFAPLEPNEDGGTYGVQRFRELGHVRTFLKSLGIGAEHILEALRQLAAGRSASVPNVTLSDEALRREGLDSSPTQKRSKR
jgi:hypothetical protein